MKTRTLLRTVVLWLGVILMFSGVFVASALRASESISIVIIGVIGIVGYGLTRLAKHLE